MQVNMVIIVRCAAKVNIVIQMMLQIPVFSAQRENTRIKRAKLFVFLVYQERMKINLGQNNAKTVEKVSTATKESSSIVPTVLLPKLRRYVPLTALNVKQGNT